MELPNIKEYGFYLNGETLVRTVKCSTLEKAKKKLDFLFPENHNIIIKEIKQGKTSIKIDMEKSYSYITTVLERQGKPLPYSTMYGDGTIFNNDRLGFIALYSTILKHLGWVAANDFSA